MRDDELREALRRMAAGDLSPESVTQGGLSTRHIVEQVGHRRRRRVVGAAIAAAAAVVVVTAVALSAGSGPASVPEPADSPTVGGVTDMPTSPPDDGRPAPRCELGVEIGQSQWSDHPDAVTASEAIEDWALPGETVQTVTDGKRAYVAFFGRTGLRMVAELKREEDGWYGTG